MHVSVIEPGQDQFAAGIDHFGLRTAPRVNFCARAYSDDTIADYGDCFGPGMLFIYRIDGSIGYDQCCRWVRLGVRVNAGHKDQNIGRKLTFDNPLTHRQAFVRLEIWLVKMKAGQNDTTGKIHTREFLTNDYDAALQLWQRVEGLEIAEGDDRQSVAQFLAR